MTNDTYQGAVTMPGTFHNLARRDVLKLAGMGLVGASGSGWFPALAQELATNPQRRRHAILLWMTGGPSQTDTFDMKPDHINGGSFKEVETAVPGLRFSEHLPKLAEQADRLAIIRSLATKEGDHDRGTHLVRTGHPPGTDVRYPSIACSLSKELHSTQIDLPNYVSVGAQQFSPAAFGPGFLGPKYAPATVGTNSEEPAPDATEGFAELRLENLELPEGITTAQATRRFALWDTMQRGFLRDRQHAHFTAHHTLYNQAFAMMHGQARAAFDLDSEPPKVREAYGRGRFGQGCLLARRLIERGVPFVEISLGSGIGWDTHQDNFTQVQRLSAELDAGWGTLMRELGERGLLDLTTILWMGEFGRTPQINEMGGRDHFPNAWTCVFAGGGIQGGQAYGKTNKDGTAIEESQVDIGDVLATLCAAVGVAPSRENETPAGRPIKLAEGRPIDDILA
jgi:hypothetical protein